jgi:hypothetical protein
MSLLKPLMLFNAAIILGMMLTGYVRATSAPNQAAIPNLSIQSINKFRFTWTDVTDATYYQIWESPDHTSDFSQVGSNIVSGTQAIDYVVPLYARLNATYIMKSCNATGCIDSSVVSFSKAMVNSIVYINTRNTEAKDKLGNSISLSADGNTLAVDASDETYNTKSIKIHRSNNTESNSGAVYVFTRNGSTWIQQAYIKVSNTEPNDSVNVSVNSSNKDDNLASNSGFIYVFTRNGSTWTQQAYIKASSKGVADALGHSVSLSADGNTLAVGTRL